MSGCTFICQNNRTPLCWAVKTRDIRLCKALLSHPKIDVNCFDFYSRSALLTACSVSNNALVVRALASHPDVNLNMADQVSEKRIEHTNLISIYSDHYNALL